MRWGLSACRNKLPQDSSIRVSQPQAGCQSRQVAVDFNGIGTSTVDTSDALAYSGTTEVQELTTEAFHSPKDNDLIVNYCPVCGLTERRPFKNGDHWATPFYYRDAWWARGPCPPCIPK